MRHIHHIFYVLSAVLVLTLSGCSRDEDHAPLPADYVPISEFDLGWWVDDNQVYTRAEQSVYTENRVVNLFVLLFDESGKLLHKKRYYVGGDGSLPSGYDALITSYNEKQEENGLSSRGSIPGFFDDFDEYTALQNRAVSFYAVANYNTALGNQLNVEELTEDQLQNLTIRFSTEGSVSRTTFTMVATNQNVRLNVVNGDDGQPMIQRVGVNLTLRRLDAKITFNLVFDIEGAVDGTVAFNSMAYRVHNVPNVSYIFEKDKPAETAVGMNNTWDAAEAEVMNGDYSCMMDDNFETFDSTFTDRVGGQFSFYLRENRPIPKKEITIAEQGNWSTLYAMREAWSGGTSDSKTPAHGRDFIYAPLHSTFVEISGELSYTRQNNDGTQEEVYGNVTYLIHLGETGNNANDQNAVNNYDVRRNVRYIYNVTVRGVNDMIVEVETGEERPGIEGDITVSTNKQYELDAHYGRVLLELNKNNLDSAVWNVTTPLGTIRSETGITSPYDYKWVLFAINKQFGGRRDAMVKFPGTQAYNGGLKFHTGTLPTKKDMQNDIGWTKDKWLTSDYSNYYYRQRNDLDKDACLRDINQLVNYLKKEAATGSDLFEKDGTVAITAFIDEYTYLYDPTKEDYIHPGKAVTDTSRLALWKEYVNVADRSMDIVPMSNTHISPDGNTSVTNSFITISQNSIKTIYNTSNSATAWGLETTNETGLLGLIATPSSTATNSTNDGRNNFMGFWSGRTYRWTEVMTTDVAIESAQGLNPAYRDAIRACMTRNRDLNGNNIIDDNEIFWYLAAKDQLTGLWIGQPSLDESAWMYQGDGTVYNHLVSSSYRNYTNDFGQQCDYWIIWAEEGSSFGGSDADDHSKVSAYDYRCIRNLGVAISDADQSVAHYATNEGRSFDPGTQSSYYTVDVTRLNSRAIRSSSDDGRNLPIDNEQSQNNRPYSKFDVLVRQYPTNDEWTTMIDDLNHNINPCPEGWRIPNQREITILLNTLNTTTELTWNGVSPTITTFSYNGLAPNYTSVRYGFLYSGGSNGNIFLYNDKDNEKNFNYRCVRDHID